MADLAAQREARRKKIAMNAQARMNKLLGNEKELDSCAVGEKLMERKETSGEESLSSKENKSIDDNQSPYNLRNRSRISSPSTNTTTHALSDSSPSSSMKPSVPYKVVEDPEVPDLAEFLASREAAKAAEEKSKDNNSRKGRWTVHQYAEALRIGGCILTALLSRCSLKFDLSFLFQSIFLPFIIFEILAGYVINVHLKHLSSLQSTGSLLSSALVLCGIKPELISVYNKIMNHVMFITNDFFTFIFAFIFIHVCVG